MAGDVKRALESLGAGGQFSAVVGDAFGGIQWINQATVTEAAVNSEAEKIKARDAVMAEIVRLESSIDTARFRSDLFTDPTIIFDPATGQTVGEKHAEVRAAIASERAKL